MEPWVVLNKNPWVRPVPDQVKTVLKCLRVHDPSEVVCRPRPIWSSTTAAMVLNWPPPALFVRAIVACECINTSQNVAGINPNELSGTTLKRVGTGADCKALSVCCSPQVCQDSEDSPERARSPSAVHNATQTEMLLRVRATHHNTLHHPPPR